MGSFKVDQSVSKVDITKYNFDWSWKLSNPIPAGNYSLEVVGYIKAAGSNDDPIAASCVKMPFDIQA